MELDINAWDVVRVRDLLWAGADDRALRRDAERGRVVKIAPGVYLGAAVWGEMTDQKRYLLRIAAIAGTRRSATVFSHYSAAALLGYPIIGAWPGRVHTVVGARSGQRSSPHVVRHAVEIRDDEVIELGGLFLTNPIRTLCDLARTAPLASAVAALDRGLAGAPPALPGAGAVDREAIREQIERLGRSQGTRRARFVVEFADGASGSPGESVSRVQMHVLRIPKPQLQVRVPNHFGSHWDVDFGWEEYRAFGEFDGFAKYFAPEFTKGRTAEQVLRAEKKREDAIRSRTNRTFARWDWAVALSLPALLACLAEAGVHPRPHG